MQGLSAIIRDGCYNVAHWEFAYKYFVISHEVPLLLKGQTQTEFRIKCNKILYISLMAFNILVAVISGSDYIQYNILVYKKLGNLVPSKKEIYWSEAFHFSIGIAQLISGVILLFALVVIAVALKRSNTGDQVNQMMMLIHALAFILYLVVVVVYFSYSFNFYL